MADTFTRLRQDFFDETKELALNEAADRLFIVHNRSEAALLRRKRSRTPASPLFANRIFTGDRPRAGFVSGPEKPARQGNGITKKYFCPNEPGRILKTMERAQNSALKQQTTENDRLLHVCQLCTNEPEKLLKTMHRLQKPAWGRPPPFVACLFPGSRSRGRWRSCSTGGRAACSRLSRRRRRP